ncbi:MAG: ferrous iron transporter B [Oscillospiraceae bacterium]
MGTVLLGRENDLLLALLLTAAVCLGACGTFAVSFLLSKLLHRKPPAPFVLELPPYRRPQPKKILTDAIFGKTLHVLSRAALVAAPAGLILWVLCTVQVGGMSLLQQLSRAGRGRGAARHERCNPDRLPLCPPGQRACDPGHSDAPDAAVAWHCAGAGAAAQLAACGVGAKTAFCCLIFSVFHWPCATTLQAIRRETGSLRWTLLSAALPTAVGVLLCLLVSWLVP